MLDRIRKIIVFAGIALFGLRGILPELAVLYDLRGIATAVIVSLIIFGAVAVISLHITEPLGSDRRSLER